MEYEKYYKIMYDGTYCIHFPNNKLFSKQNINDIFSSYGNVLSITSKGDINNGLIFIRYKTLKETLYCLKNLQKNNDIRILPQKDKINKHDVTRNSNEWHAGRKDNLSQKTTDKQYHSNSIRGNRINECEEKPTCNRTNSDYSNRSDHTNNFSNPSSPGSRCNYKSNINAIKSDTLHPLGLDEKYSQYSEQQNLDYKESHCNQIIKQQEIEFYEPSKPEGNTNVCNGISDKIIPSLVPCLKIQPKKSDIRFDHSLPALTKNTLSKSVTMQEVIVANIDVNYSVHYILHLFEKHSPISATLVKTISKTDIRYCLVYFMNVDDALAIEEKFDNYVLSGRNLVVLRTSQLSKAIGK